MATKKTPALLAPKPAAKTAPAAKKAAIAPKAAAKKTAVIPITDMTVPKEKAGLLKFPKTLAGCADAYYETMLERLKLQKQAAKLEEQEAALKLHIINNLPLSSATGVAGSRASVQVVKKERVEVVDWNVIQNYAVKHQKAGGFAIFQRRVNDATIKELLAKDKKFKGAKLVEYKSLSCHALKG